MGLCIQKSPEPTGDSLKIDKRQASFGAAGGEWPALFDYNLYYYALYRLASDASLRHSSRVQPGPCAPLLQR